MSKIIGEMQGEFKDLMIDLETMSDGPDAAIVSIGAVWFDLRSGRTGDEFKVNVSLESSVEVGLKISPASVLWWMNQSKEAQEAFLKGPRISLQEALCKLSLFIGKRDIKVWAKGPSFDLVILKSAYKACCLTPPWKYYNERCVRTMVDFLPLNLKMQPEHVRHSVIEDCQQQIKECVGGFKLRVNSEQ
jgi:hypothetical protein